MGQKYSINSAGRIIAERDIYSLGGFIPKNSAGAKVANKDQISQDGDCWVAGGDISGRPDVRVKDNAYIGDFVGATGMHTDGVTEFSGDTLIPGKIIVRNPIADPVNNFYAKDSFIGVSMDVLCGPSTTATAFPFEQGDLKAEAAKGTLFTSASMRLDDTSACRNTATLRLGRNTYLYIPTGYRARVFWAYYDNSNRLAYSGESTAIQAGLIKLNHSVYRLAMVTIVKADGTAMTPANLLATGAKILGHINSSANVDIRPESASGSYVMDKSSFLLNTDNFGLNTTQLRFLAGSMYDTTMYTKTDRQGYKPYGTFRNVERLEYTKYLDDSHRTAATRDTFISAYDCPLLRVGGTTYNDSLAAIGDLTLRNCIVPKASFVHDAVNGNTYEGIDFSYANEDLEYNMPGYTNFLSSHREGLYRLQSGPSSMGFVSHKGNLADTARLYQAEKYIPLDGSIMERGIYATGTGNYYEDSKIVDPNRVRTTKPIATFGLVFPSLPTGFSVKALYYLDEDFIIRSVITDPTGLVTTYPYVVMTFRKNDNSPITVSEFIALNRTLRIIDHTKAPEITGSAYVGAGVIVRGDVQLHGDPYVNRVLDVNLWEKGTVTNNLVTNGWEAAKNPPGGPTDVGRRRLKEVIPVEPGARIICNSGYWVTCYFYDYEGNYIGSPGWGQTANTAPDNAAFAGLILKKGVSVNDSSYIEDSDIPLANVKYVRAFKKRRYITNELDRNSSEDILIGPDMWEQGYLDRIAGKTYEELKSDSLNYVRLKRPVNTGKGATYTHAAGYGRLTVSFDAAAKCVSPNNEIIDGTPLCGVCLRKDPVLPIMPAEAPNTRLVLEFTPSPRIIVPYGSDSLFISGPKIRMYDNAVLSRNLSHDADIVLQGDAVMGYDFSSGGCLCSNGHDDAIIKLP
jgi:hypothetical protein